MPLDPQVQAFLADQAAQLLENPAPPILEQTPEMARQGYLALAQALGDGPEVDSIVERTIRGPGGEVPVRIYRPAAPGGVLVYYHGGGWVIGDLDTHDHLCRELCVGSSCTVVSVGYRLAPEHPFPAAVEDAMAALDWAVIHAEHLARPGAKVGVGGDSAGGNLAAAVCLRARDRGGSPIAFQLLIYPAVDMRMGHPSIDENAEGYVLTRDHMHWFRGHYLPSETDHAHPEASPLLAASHRNLPPALVITAEFDPLRDEGEDYAATLNRAGVPVTLRRYDGQIHVFLQLSPLLEGARTALGDVSAALRAALGVGGG